MLLIHFFLCMHSSIIEKIILLQVMYKADNLLVIISKSCVFDRCIRRPEYSFLPFPASISPGRIECHVLFTAIRFSSRLPVIDNVSVRVVRETRGAPHGSHQRIGTRSVGEDLTVFTGCQSICRS